MDAVCVRHIYLGQQGVITIRFNGAKLNLSEILIFIQPDLHVGLDWVASCVHCRVCMGLRRGRAISEVEAEGIQAGNVAVFGWSVGSTGY